MLIALLGLLSIGLLAGLISGSDDDGTAGPDPSDDARIVEGGDADETIFGTQRNEMIFGRDGADTVQAGGGIDFLFGGVGDDVLQGGAGGDLVAGGAGDDLLSGGYGNDLVFGGAGDDTLNGNAGNDTLVGVSGSNALKGGEGDDILDGRDVPDAWELYSRDSALFADELAPMLRAGFGPALTDALLEEFRTEINTSAPLSEGGTRDLLEGDRGADTLIGDSGDRLVGGAGTDLFIVASLRDDQSYLAPDYLPVRIGDYDQGDATIAAERLEIVLDLSDRLNAVESNPDLRQVGRDTHLVGADGRTVAILENRMAENLDRTNFVFVRQAQISPGTT